MMKLRRIVSFCLAALLCVSLWGCTSAPVTSQTGDGQPLETSGESLNVYKAKVKDFPVEEVLEIFPHQNEFEEGYPEERESQFFPDTTRYLAAYIRDKDSDLPGGQLSVEPGMIFFRTKEWHDYPLQWFLDPKYSLEVFPDGVDKACPKQDLWFMTWDEAHAFVQDYLDRLGVEYYGEDWLCYPVTGEFLTEVVARHYPLEQYEQAVANGAIPSKRELGKEDDVYMFRIPLAVDGCLLVQDESSFIGRGYAEAMVGSTGLWYLQIWFPYEVTGTDSSKATVTEEAALGLVEEYYAKMPNVDPEDLTVSCQGIRYDPRAYAVDNCELLPVWVIEAVRMIDDIKVTNVFHIDAITGELSVITQ